MAMITAGPSKHVLYHELVEAFGQDGCPICRLGLRAARRYLDVLSYEGVNDPRWRAELRAARGFCNRHAWQFAEEIHDGLGTAIIYHDIVGELLRVLGSPGGRGLSHAQRALAPGILYSDPTKLAADLVPQRTCPACRCLADTSQRYVDTLLAHVDDPLFRSRYLASDGLCLPHLAQCLQQARTVVAYDLLLSTFARRVASLPDPSAAAEMLVGREKAVCFDTLPASAVNGVDEGLEQCLSLFAEVPIAPGDGCPVCRSAIGVVDGWLKALVDGPASERVVFAEHGPPVPFCNAHAWRLLKIVRGGQASAALHLPLMQAENWLRSHFVRPAHEPLTWYWLQTLLGQLARLLRKRRPVRWQLEGHCPACAVQAAVERQMVLAMLGKAEVDDLRSGASMLCLPHLVIGLCLAAGPEQVQFLVAAQIEMLQSLRQELGEYIRKQDYRFRHEPLGTEVDSPWRAIAYMVGARGRNVQCFYVKHREH